MARTIAIVGGTGPEGSGLALRWVRAGELVILGSRDPARAQAAAQKIREITRKSTIEGSDNASAVAAADIVVLTIPFSAHAETLKQIKLAFKSTAVVIDTTVPLAATIGGKPSRVLGVWQGSAAQQAAELLPKGIALAAAFQNISSELLHSDEPVDCDAIICTDHEQARQVANDLATKIPGVRPLDGGKLENARIVEQITALLITLNLRHKVHSAGLRITGISIPPQH